MSAPDDEDAIRAEYEGAVWAQVRQDYGRWVGPGDPVAMLTAPRGSSRVITDADLQVEVVHHREVAVTGDVYRVAVGVVLDREDGSLAIHEVTEEAVPGEGPEVHSVYLGPEDIAAVRRAIGGDS